MSDDYVAGGDVLGAEWWLLGTMSYRRYGADLLIAMVLLLLPLVMFWPQTLGGRTLIPTENLYQYEPYATYREVIDTPEFPQNHLVSDLILQNFQWKSFIRQNIAEREIPLWNPHQFSGIPFLAAGQQSIFYPLSILYYVMPLVWAYGWFTVLNLWLAGLFMYALLRGLGMGRLGGIIAGITYQLCGFLIASAVFPMIIGAAVWMPLLLLIAEFIIRRQPVLGQQSSVPWVVVGAGGLACNIFAGHVEMTIYTLLILAYYSATRLILVAWENRRITPESMKAGLWLTLMVALGIGIALVQFVPLYEVAQNNWRAERNDLSTVLGYAHKPRDIVQYALPNFYGSPAHNRYFDVFSMQTEPVAFENAAGEMRHHTEWGIKNYVEGALYVGIMPLILAGLAIIGALSRFFIPRQRQQIIIFALLAFISLTFMFGLPTYAVIYALPGINQLNSPFRWVFGVTLSVSILAGFGIELLGNLDFRMWARRIGYGLLVIGVVLLGGVFISRIFYNPLESLIERVFNGLANADLAFADAGMFYSYQLINVLILGVMVFLSGLVLIGVRYIRQKWLWGVFASGVIAVDLLIASWGFNPASDPLLLEFTPASIAWLLGRQHEETPFRYTTLEAPNQHAPLLIANSTMHYGLDDIRGYDSIISAQYVDYMRATSLQNVLDFNRIAPLYINRFDEINWKRLDLLNVRYIVVHNTTMPRGPNMSTRSPVRFQQVYRDEAVEIWRNNAAFERVFVVQPESDNQMQALENFESIPSYGVTITTQTNREKFINLKLQSEDTHWLVISETYDPGWRAFVRPHGMDESTEQQVKVELVWENFQGVRLHPEELALQFEDLWHNSADPQTIRQIRSQGYDVRLVYSPISFQVGVFGSGVSAALLVFLVGMWVWRLLVAPSTENDATVSRVARNSVAPIILNLFNRGIDFAFALVMLRILGPEDSGIYYYAIVVFVWFDIFTNFGLDVFIMREVSRRREQSSHYLLNSSLLRLLLMFACIPLLLGFLLLRQALIEPPLEQRALITIGLLYLGLAPGSLNKGLTSIFYAFEKAEIPAAVTTITTINNRVLGLFVLLLGYGIIGLAAVSIFVNLVTLMVLLWAARPLRGSSQAKLDTTLVRSMTREGWPLMLNHFLATIFFQIDIVILETLKGVAIVGKYSVAYRWLLALNIIPAFFTQALLPVMSRQANEDHDSLKRTYTLGVKLLLIVSLPVAVAMTFMAEILTFILGGQDFLPEGAVALQIMIWSIPVGWTNSLTQYALIALDLQRRITTAFVVAVTFNIVSNILLIPPFGFRAAAITTILSEAVLFIPFALLMTGTLGHMNWLDIIWRPIIASGAMAAVLVVGWSIQPVLVLTASGAIYIIALLALKPLSDVELSRLMPLLSRFSSTNKSQIL